MDRKPPNRTRSGADPRAFTSSRRVLRELGRGRLGVTRVIVHEGPGGFLKLKIEKQLDPKLAADPRFVDAFLAGAKLSARLHHPNIAIVYEVAPPQAGRGPALVCEHIEGVSLDALIEAEPQETAALLYAITQALVGLDHAHAEAEKSGAPPVHGTLGARSIMVSFEGAVKLVDFGLPSPPDESTRAGRQDTAPEGAIDRRSDVYAMGALLERVAGALAEPPQELEEIIARAKAAAPLDRFATADELRAAIEAHLEDFGETVSARAVAEIMTRAFGQQREESRSALARVTMSGATRSSTKTAAREADRAREQRARRIYASIAIAAVTLAAVVVTAVLLRARTQRSAAVAIHEAPLNAPCTSNAACNTSGRPTSICRTRDGVCVPLASAQCTTMADPHDIESDDTLWLGAMFPTTGPEAMTTGRENLRALELARRDFAAASGLPRAAGGTRAVAIVACDDGTDPARAARHLVDELELPAVIGFARSQELIELATSTFIPRHVLAMSSINMSSLITTIPHPVGSPRLVWRTMYTTTDWALPAARLVSQIIEPELRRGPLGRTSPLRVAVVTASNATGLAFSDALVSSLTYNGKPALENAGNFLHLLYPEGARARWGTLAATLIGFRPHVVVYEGGDEFLRGVAEPLEAKWPADEPTRPFYIAGASLTPRAFAFSGNDAQRRHRFFGIVPRPNTTENAEFVLRYNDAFPEPVTVTSNPNSTYDAFYVLAYAAYAAMLDGDSRVTGDSLARAIARLVPPGPSVPIGPSHIFDALAHLRAGEHIDLAGAVGKLDFDLRTGDAPSEEVVLCIDVDEDGNAVDSVESGLVYDTRTKRLEGALHCK